MKTFFKNLPLGILTVVWSILSICGLIILNTILLFLWYSWICLTIKQKPKKRHLLALIIVFPLWGAVLLTIYAYKKAKQQQVPGHRFYPVFKISLKENIYNLDLKTWKKIRKKLFPKKYETAQ